MKRGGCVDTRWTPAFGSGFISVGSEPESDYQSGACQSATAFGHVTRHYATSRLAERIGDPLIVKALAGPPEHFDNAALQPPCARAQPLAALARVF